MRDARSPDVCKGFMFFCWSPVFSPLAPSVCCIVPFIFSHVLLPLVTSPGLLPPLSSPVPHLVISVCVFSLWVSFTPCHCPGLSLVVHAPALLCHFVSSLVVCFWFLSSAFKYISPFVFPRSCLLFHCCLGPPPLSIVFPFFFLFFYPNLTLMSCRGAGR